MQGQITLSKKERHYQFFYLILMLITAMLFLGVIFLKGFESPFSDEDVREFRILNKKLNLNSTKRSLFRSWTVHIR